jgi:hypothetical protein
MADLARRLEALESRAGFGQCFTAIIRKLVRPGCTDMEAGVMVSYGSGGGAGWRCDRQKGETEAAFLERAAATAPRAGRGMPRLLATANRSERTR